MVSRDKDFFQVLHWVSTHYRPLLTITFFPHRTDYQNIIREPLKKTQEFRICSEKGGGSRPIRNPYFDLVSEDPMLTGSPNQENEQVFRWFRTCFSDENSQIKKKLSIKIKSETPIREGGLGVSDQIRNSWGFLLKGSLICFFKAGCALNQDHNISCTSHYTSRNDL